MAIMEITRYASTVTGKEYMTQEEAQLAERTYDIIEYVCKMTHISREGATEVVNAILNKYNIEEI